MSSIAESSLTMHSAEKPIGRIHAGKLVKEHVLILLMVSACVQRMNNTFIQAGVRGAQINNSERSHTQTFNHRDEFKNKREKATSAFPSGERITVG